MRRLSISEISWEELASAHGSSAHFPSAFEMLGSSEPNEREAAYWKLDNYAVLQGDLYEVAPFAADAIIGILESTPEFLGKKQAYDFLIEVANGGAPPDSFSGYSGEKTDLVTACRMAIRHGMAAYLFDLSHASREIRVGAAELLLSCSDDLSDQVDVIQDKLTKETDEEVRGLLQEVLDAIPKQSS